MADSECGKLFVGGISWDTDEVVLKDYFSRYGDVSSSVIAKDHNSRSPRGFGFITFSDPSSADKALNGQHEIMGRTVDVKRAIPRSEPHQYHQTQREYDSCSGCGGGSNVVNNQFRTRKIFVGGLPASVTQEQFRRYFERFGRITDIVVMHDNSTNRPRGFGFITFDSEDVVDRIVQNSFYDLGGKSVEVKRAIPKDFSRNMGNGHTHNPRNSNGGSSGSSPYGGYWLDNHWDGGVRYGFYPGQGYYHHGYGFNGYYGAMYPMGGYGPVRYCSMPTMPMIPMRSPWNDLGMVRFGPMPDGSASFYNMNGGVGASVSGSVSVSNDAVCHRTKQSNSHIDGGNGDAMGNEAMPWVNSGRDNGHGSSGGKMKQSNVHVKKNQGLSDGKQKSGDFV